MRCSPAIRPKESRTFDSFEGNLTPPVGGKPALLTHREVETIFHEFGHLLHHLLSRVEVRSLAGTSVAWDFVELPSQMRKSGVGAQTLDQLRVTRDRRDHSREDLYQKMKRAKTFRAANARRCGNWASQRWIWRCIVSGRATETRSLIPAQSFSDSRARAPA